MDMQYTVDAPDISGFVADLEAAGGNAEALVNAALANSTSHMQANIRDRAPHRTGSLQRSVQTEVNYPEATVTVEEKYGSAVETGTGIYGPEGRPIVPQSKKALAFMMGGVQVVVRSIKGMRAQPFFQPGIEASKGYIDRQFEKVVDIIIRGLAR